MPRSCVFPYRDGCSARATHRFAHRAPSAQRLPEGTHMHVMRKRSAAIGVALAAAVVLAACGSSGSKASPPKGSTTSPASTVTLTPTSFTVDFSAMAQLKPLVEKGEGLIGVLLPDTTTSARYETF